MSLGPFPPHFSSSSLLSPSPPLPVSTPRAVAHGGSWRCCCDRGGALDSWVIRCPFLASRWFLPSPASSLPPTVVVVPSSSSSPLSHLIVLLLLSCPHLSFPLAPSFLSHCSLFPSHEQLLVAVDGGCCCGGGGGLLLSLSSLSSLSLPVVVVPPHHCCPSLPLLSLPVIVIVIIWSLSWTWLT
jgi:hypothetical protein